LCILETVILILDTKYTFISLLACVRWSVSVVWTWKNYDMKILAL